MSTEYEIFARNAGLLDYNPYNTYDGPFDAKKDMQLMASRELGINGYGFAILTEDAIERLKKYAPILEIGAGLGYWAYEFQKRGVDYVATEPHPNSFGNYFKKSKLWVSMEKLEASEAVSKYPGRALLICWPSYQETWAAAALRAYDGPAVIYVGEGYEGCTGDNEFHEILYRDWKETEEIRIPQWRCIHDRIWVYIRP